MVYSFWEAFEKQNPQVFSEFADYCSHYVASTVAFNAGIFDSKTIENRNKAKIGIESILFTYNIDLIPGFLINDIAYEVVHHIYKNRK